MEAGPTVVVISDESTIGQAILAAATNGSFPLPLCRGAFWDGTLDLLLVENHFDLIDPSQLPPVSPSEEPVCKGPLDAPHHFLWGDVEPTLASIARQYCIARNRPLSSLTGLEDLDRFLVSREAEAVESIVIWGLAATFPLALVDEIEFQVAEKSLSTGQRRIVSFMAAENISELLFLAFKSLLAFYSSAPVPRDALFDAVSGHDSPILPDDPHTIGIAQDQAEALTNERVGFLSVLAHGRPYEFAAGLFHGQDATVCFRRPGVTRSPSELGPICSGGVCCYRDGMCPRHHRIPIGSLRADIIFINSCGSFRLGDGDTEQSQGLTVRANDSPCAGYISSRYTHEGGRDMNLKALAAWQSGCTLAAIVRLISPPKVPLYSLLGDPELRRRAVTERLARLPMTEDTTPPFIETFHQTFIRAADVDPESLPFQRTDGSRGCLERIGKTASGEGLFQVTTPSLSATPPLQPVTMAEQELTACLLKLPDELLSLENSSANFASAAAEAVQKSYRLRSWPVAVIDHDATRNFRSTTMSGSLDVKGRCFGCGLRTLQSNWLVERIDYTRQEHRVFEEDLIEKVCPKCFRISCSTGSAELTIECQSRVALGASLAVDVQLNEPANGTLWVATYYSESSLYPKPATREWVPPAPAVINGSGCRFLLPGLNEPGIAYIRAYFISHGDFSLAAASRQLHVVNAVPNVHFEAN